MQDKNSRVFSRLLSNRCSLNVGINATAIEPSAKRRRNKFGSKKATEKASDNAVVPRNLAFVISLNKPRTRDAKVSKDRADP
jgi:hypothetical protein